MDSLHGSSFRRFLFKSSSALDWTPFGRLQPTASASERYHRDESWGSALTVLLCVAIVPRDVASLRDSENVDELIAPLRRPRFATKQDWERSNVNSSSMRRTDKGDKHAQATQKNPEYWTLA